MQAYARHIESSPPPLSAVWTGGIARGDPEALGAFYEIWFDRVFALARSFSRRDESFCLDVVQDVMMRVVKSMRSMDDEAAVAAWMARTVYSAAVDKLRSEQRRRKREERVAQDKGEAYEASPSTSLMTAEQRAWIAARLEELPEEDRRLVLARFEGDMTLDQVGAAFGMTGHAAHGRIRRIVQRLQQAAREWV